MKINTLQRASEAAWIESRQRWQVNVQADGKRKTFTSAIRGRKGKHEAEAKADEWLLSQGNPTVTEAWDACIEAVKVRYATTTVSSRKATMRKHVLPIVGEMRIGDVKLKDWQKCVDTACAAGRSTATVGNVLATIGLLTKYCRRRGWPVEVPLPGDIIMPRAAAVNPRSALAADKIRLLFAESQQGQHLHWLYAWRLMALTGMRRGEMCGLKWEDVRGNYLRVERAVNALHQVTDGKTINAKRIVVLSEMARNVLDKQAQYLAEKHIETEWIFPDPEGGMPNPDRVRREWRKYSAEMGIDCKMHELRHTFVTLVKNDMPLALLKSQVGHSAEMDTIGVYGHTTANDMTEIARIIDGAYLRVIK